MNDKFPTCEKCRQEKPCVKVATVFGDRNLCIAACFGLWGMMIKDLKKRVGQLLEEHHTDFFDEPTIPDIPKELLKGKK